MPDGYRLPDPALLNLAEFLLLRQLGEPVRQYGRRNFGANRAIAYSGGVDSTAALALIGPAIPLYTQTVDPRGRNRQENALLALADVGGIAIPTDSDRLAPALGKPTAGFYGTGAFTIPAVLLADHFDIGIVADGNVLETAYLYSSHGHGTGYKFVDRTEVIERFHDAGLHYCMPCAGLTEVSTTRLAQGSRFAMGCVRGQGGNPCGSCVKCYRKGALQGQKVVSNSLIEEQLRKPVIPMLPSLLWAVRHKGLHHPILDRIKKDIDWVDQWMVDAARYIPAHLQDEILARLRSHGIHSLRDDSPIRNWISSASP